MRKMTMSGLTMVCVACCLFMCIFSGILSCHSSSRSGPIDTTVCEIVDKCAQFDGKHVRVKAELISDGLEASSLVDAVTPAKCQLGIRPETSHDIDGHEDIKALDRALTQGQRGTLDKRIVADFTGQYECDSGRNRILHIERVNGLAVTRRPE